MNLSLRVRNPVLDRELRQRSRSARSMVVLSLFLAMLIGVLYLAFKGNEASAGAFGNPLAALSGSAGRAMFEWVLTAELVILLFIIPGISAGAIAGERDRQTLIPLQVTLIGPARIFWGKVLASSGFILLLVVASTPVLAVPYLAGGVSLTQVVVSMATLVATGLLLATMGVGCSAIFRRTQTATLAAYFLMLTLTIGSVVGLAAVAIFNGATLSSNADAGLLPLYPNPFLALADVAGRADNANTVGPLSPLKQSVSRVGDSVVASQAVGGGREIVVQAPVPVATTVFAQVVNGGEARGGIAVTTVPPTTVLVTRPDGAPTEGAFTEEPSTTVFAPGAGPVLLDGGPNGVDRNRPGAGGPPMWLRSLLAQTLIAGGLAVLAVRRLRAPQPELHT